MQNIDLIPDLIKKTESGNERASVDVHRILNNQMPKTHTTALWFRRRP